MERYVYCGQYDRIQLRYDLSDMCDPFWRYIVIEDGQSGVFIDFDDVDDLCDKLKFIAGIMAVEGNK